jgi:hypothetical protein
MASTVSVVAMAVSAVRALAVVCSLQGEHSRWSVQSLSQIVRSEVRVGLEVREGSEVMGLAAVAALPEVASALLPKHQLARTD